MIDKLEDLVVLVGSRGKTTNSSTANEAGVRSFIPSFYQDRSFRDTEIVPAILVGTHENRGLDASYSMWIHDGVDKLEGGMRFAPGSCVDTFTFAFGNTTGGEDRILQRRLSNRW